MSACVIVAIALFVAAFYFLLTPLILRRTLLHRFDGDLFRTEHWQSVEELFPLYRYRRAMIYLGVLGWPGLARRRFPGYDFRPKSTPMLRLLSRLYLSAGALGLLFALYQAVVGFRC